MTTDAQTLVTGDITGAIGFGFFVVRLHDGLVTEVVLYLARSIMGPL